MQPKFGSHMVTRTASLQQGLGRAEPLVRVGGGAGRNLPEAERFFAFAQRGEFTDLSWNAPCKINIVSGVGGMAPGPP